MAQILANVFETYHFMSQKYFTHATPTLFNAGTPKPQLSSCYLLKMEDDSIEGIYNTLKDCALISKMAGGIGLHIHNVRACGSHIRGTNGTSNGIVPMLRVFNNTAKYVDQCVHPETIIYTSEGPIQIHNCTAGKTHIINRTGKTEIIQNMLEHYYEGKMLFIKTEYCEKPLRITPEHPVYVLRSDMYEWVDANELRVGDRILSTIPTYEVDVENIHLDECHMYGYIFNHGMVDMHTGNYSINLHSLSRCDIQFIKDYLTSHLVSFEKDSYAGFICWKPALHLPFRYGDFYAATGEKWIHSRWLHLPLDKLSQLYANLRNITMTIPNQVQLIELQMSTKCTVFDQLQYIRLRLSQTVLPEGAEYTNMHDMHMISSRITEIKETDYKGILYDLQMETHHNYLLEHGLVHNGGGKRNGSFAIYLEPWHADIELFLRMRKNHGDEELKARDLFYALWISDLFMERVKANGKWTLMCPDECPGLADVYGDEFKSLYETYESEIKVDQL
jgi:hypothetical protein